MYVGRWEGEQDLVYGVSSATLGQERTQGLCFSSLLDGGGLVG